MRKGGEGPDLVVLGAVGRSERKKKKKEEGSGGCMVVVFFTGVVEMVAGINGGFQRWSGRGSERTMVQLLVLVWKLGVFPAMEISSGNEDGSGVRCCGRGSEGTVVVAGDKGGGERE
ncbi:hypothetical protein HAX54_049085, partial [Datura stramonium]|nr:hypothetical protein [Datura stramonium]